MQRTVKLLIDVGEDKDLCGEDCEWLSGDQCLLFGTWLDSPNSMEEEDQEEEPSPPYCRCLECLDAEDEDKEPE